MRRLIQFLAAAFAVHAITFSFAQDLNMEKLKGMVPRSVGPAGMSGRITAIQGVISNPDIIYAGAASGGLWRSTSGGISWEPLFDKETVLSIGAIAVQQDNPSVLWVGTGEGNPRNSLNGGNGIYKSLDAGKTWKLMGLEGTRNIHRIIIDPKSPNTVYVASIGSPWGEHPERGVFKTTDGGDTWSKVLFENNRTGCADLVMDPTNPNKLIAAMWEHRRWPWTFKSGGPGSSLQITFDGGKSWTKVSAKDGLPEGELGRIGVAIAWNKPEIVYALVESKNNALYRSEDGGFKWTKVNDKGEIGNRPFYYSEIYVDPENENRIYSLFSLVNMSEDGGKSFRTLLPYSGVHPDHHAWWINPENPSFMIDGNDGGLNITYDKGKTWRFVENIPVGQFYHVNVDMDYPYNLYGGMQDNGSWVGPAYTWTVGGMRNSFWQEILFGDGFDAMPDLDDNRYGFAMSQGGSLARFDKKTGHTQTLRPTHPNADLKLRFNWNAGMAQDPHHHATIYYGSQFLHKSTDKGNTWEIISPDLTTNDPAKQKQNESGGLTIDATGAENFCTIIAIAPSPKDAQVIWAGTDDGNVQLTRDGGKTWTNMSARITGMPKGAWVPQIQASSYNAGEALVVVNNYRQYDFKPYLFRTRDYGQTWENLMSASAFGSNGFALAVAQDPVEPRLMFAGTESGLWVSIDEGKSWTRWTNEFPAGVPTMDLVIHPREFDLVIATFGRAFYVLDDIRPLREMAKTGASLLSNTLHVFTPPDAYLAETIQPDGIRFQADAMFQGQNRASGALISYVINRPQEKKADAAPAKPNKKSTTKQPEVKAPEGAEKSDTKPKVKYDSVTMQVLDAENRVIRTIKFKAPEEDGLHRTTWNLSQKGAASPSRQKQRRDEPQGEDVLPGSYKLRLLFGDAKDSTTIHVKDDPRLGVSPDVRRQRHATIQELEELQGRIAEATDRLREAKEIVTDYDKRIKQAGGDELKEAAAKTKAMKDSIDAIFDFALGKEERGQSIIRSPEPTPVSFINRAKSYIRSARGPLNDTDRRVKEQAEEKAKPVIARVNTFFEKEWPAYRELMEKVRLSPFKDYEPIKQ